MYEKPFKTYSINNKLSLRNRFVMAPMTTWSGNEDGTVSSDELEYYHYRSYGAGMIITATTYVEPEGKGFDNQFYSGSDDMLPSLKALSETIHRGGARAILQMFHAGRKANPLLLPGKVSLSASSVAGKREGGNIPREMTHEEILATVQSFGDATLRAHKAGFDGVEIHGANTYLLQQFFSPHSNVRTDHWGGSLVRRSHFPLAVIESCIKAKGEIDNENFIIGYRFSPEENSEPGITLDDTDFLVDALCGTELDYIHLSTSHFMQSSMRDGHDDSPILERVVRHINNRKPLIAVGSVRSMEETHRIMGYGADLVALGRQLLIDGRTIEKWQNHEEALHNYDPRRQGEEHIPDNLHQKIMETENWVPMVNNI